MNSQEINWSALMCPRALFGLILLPLKSTNNAMFSEVNNIVAGLKPNLFSGCPLSIDHVMYLSFHNRTSGTPVCCEDRVSHSLCLVLSLNSKKCNFKQNFAQSLTNTADRLSSKVL